MPAGVVETLRIVYQVDVVDKGTKQLLASERAAQKSVVQTSRALAQHDAAQKRSATVTTSTAARKSSAHVKSGAAAQTGATQMSKALASQDAAQRRSTAVANAEISKRSAARQREVASARVTATKVAASTAAPAGRRPRRPAGVVSSAGTAASSARSNVGFAAGIAGAVGLSQTIKFDRALRNVNSIAGLTEKQLQAVGQRLRDMAPEAAQMPQTLAEGLYDLVSSGFDVEESMTIIDKSARAASAGLTTTEVSTAAVAAVLNAYRRPAKDAGAVSDLLFKTVDRGVISFEALASNIGTVLPVAASLGVGLDQVGAALATMTKQGIGPEEAVVRLQGAMTKFIKPSEAMAVALKKLGVSGEQLVRDKGVQGAIEAVAATTDGTKEAFAALFPDVRAMQGALALTGQNAKTAKEDLVAMGKSGGATQKALAEQSKSTAYQWNQAKANAQALAITVGNGLLPKLNSALKTFSDLPGPVKIAFTAIAAGALVIGPINKLRKNVGELGESIVSVGKRAAKSNIATRLAEGASGAGGKIRNALGGVKSVVERLMTGAGNRGGVVVADHIASSAGVNMGPALDRNQKKFRGGRWTKMGQIAGRTFGVAAAAIIAGELTVEVTSWIKKQPWYKPPGGKGSFWDSLIPESLLPSKPKRRGGIIRRYQHGGLVPILAAGGEMLVDGGRATMLPGRPDRDGTPMLVRPGAAILTADGQARMSMGASLTEAVRSQAPHFAKGGVVPGKYTATAYGPPWGGIQGTGVTRTGVNLKGNPKVYGIATDPRMIPLGSKVFAHPNPFSYTGRFSAFDTGGAIKGRRIDFYDWRGRRHQKAWGRRQVTVSRSRLGAAGGGGSGASRAAIEAQIERNMDQLDKLRDQVAAIVGKDSTARRRPIQAQIRKLVRVNRKLRAQMRDLPKDADGTTKVPIILGKARRRAGLLTDAFAQGQAAGQAGLTRAIIRREGNPVLAALREAQRPTDREVDTGGSGTTGRGSGSDADVGSVAGASVKGAKPGFAVLMALFRKKFGSGIYVMSGARPGSRVAGSNRVSNHASGDAIDITHKGIESASRSRPPESLNRAGARRMDRLHRYIGWRIPRPPRRDFLWRTNQGGNHFNHIHLGMDPSATKTVGTARAFLRGRSTDTLRGLPRGRRGGIIRRFQGGGFVAGGGHAAGNAGGAVGTQLSRGLRTAMTFAGGSLEALDDIIGRSLQHRLVALREQLERRVRKGGPAKVVQRLQSAIDMIDFELGRRVGRIQDVVEQRVSGIDRARGAVERSQRARGVEQGGLQSVVEMGAFQQVETNVRAQNVQSLTSALQRATAAKNRDAIREITTQLADAHDALQESTVQQIELAREAARLMREAVANQAQEIVDTYTSQSSMADLGLQRLELEQRLIGTHGSTGGAIGRADYIRQNIIPAIQQEIAALDLQRQVAQAQGNADLVRQLNEQIFGRTNDILARQLDAQEQTAENTEPLKEFSGSSAFSYRDQLFTDLDFIRARAGA